jgi:hypothetical protein
MFGRGAYPSRTRGESTSAAARISGQRRRFLTVLRPMAAPDHCKTRLWACAMAMHPPSPCRAPRPPSPFPGRPGIAPAAGAAADATQRSPRRAELRMARPVAMQHCCWHCLRPSRRPARHQRACCCTAGADVEAQSLPQSAPAGRRLTQLPATGPAAPRAADAIALSCCSPSLSPIRPPQKTRRSRNTKASRDRRPSTATYTAPPPP